MSILKSFFVDRRGAIIMIFAFAMPVLLGLIGLVIDGGRLLYLQSKFEDCVKASALATSKHISPSTEVFVQFLQANFPDKPGQSVLVLPEVTMVRESFNQLRFEAAATVSLLVVPNLKIGDSTALNSTMTIRTNYTILHPQRTLELALVISNGMPTPEVQALAQAVSKLVDTIHQDPTYAEHYYSIIPYGGGVTLPDNPALVQYITNAPVARKYGSGADDFITYTGTYQNDHFVGFKYLTNPHLVEVYTPPPIYKQPSKYLLTLLDKAPNRLGSAQLWETLIQPLTDPIPDNKYYDPRPLLRSLITAPYDNTDESPSSYHNLSWGVFQYYTHSLQSLMSLRSNVEEIKQHLAAMKRHEGDDKNPNHNHFPGQGMAWARRILSPKWRGNWLDNTNSAEQNILPRDYNYSIYHDKIVLLVTYGLSRMSAEGQTVVGRQDYNTARQRAHFELFKEELMCAATSAQCAMAQYYGMPCHSCSGNDPAKCACPNLEAAFQKWYNANLNSWRIHASVRSPTNPEQVALGSLEDYLSDLLTEHRQFTDYRDNNNMNIEVTVEGYNTSSNDNAIFGVLSSSSNKTTPICGGIIRPTRDSVSKMNLGCGGGHTQLSYPFLLQKFWQDTAEIGFGFSQTPNGPDLGSTQGMLALQVGDNLHLRMEEQREIEEELFKVKRALLDLHNGAYSLRNRTHYETPKVIIKGESYSGQQEAEKLLNQEILEICQSMKAPENNIQIYVVDYLSSTDEQLIAYKCSSFNKKNYYYVDDAQNFAAVFEEITQTILTPTPPVIIGHNTPPLS